MTFINLTIKDNKTMGRAMKLRDNVGLIVVKVRENS